VVAAGDGNEKAKGYRKHNEDKRKDEAVGSMSKYRASAVAISKEESVKAVMKKKQ